MVRRHAGALFVFDYIDVGDDTAARYRPTRRTKCDRPTAESFVHGHRADLVAESVGEQCKSNLRTPRGVASPRKAIGMVSEAARHVDLGERRFGLIGYGGTWPRKIQA
jgi:hypothetical protein